jgi:hypothetical protein
LWFRIRWAGSSSGAHHSHSQTIILKIAEAVRLPLQDFDLGVEAFSDPVVSRKAPHGGDLDGPRREGLSELYELIQACLAQFVQGFKKTVRQGDTLFPRFMLLEQQVAVISLF